VTKAGITKHMVFEGTALIAGPSFRSGPARLYTGFRGNPIPKLSKPPDLPLGQTRKEADFAHYNYPSSHGLSPLSPKPIVHKNSAG
jgi:hypothetical protein